MMQYTRDYDEFFPLAHNWSESLYPYSKDDTLFTCPTAPQHGYSLNRILAVTAMSRLIEIEKTPLVFESSVLRLSQHDKGTSWLREPRHPQGVALVYTNGHTEWRKQPPPFPKIAPPPKRLPPIIIMPKRVTPLPKFSPYPR